MSPVAPYVPVHRPPLATEVDQTRMAEKLAKRSKSHVSVDVSPAGQSRNEKSDPESWPKAPRENAPSTQPPRPLGKLIWAERDVGSMGRYTTCHWYSCCQINRGTEVTYEVWTREPLTSGMKQLAVGLASFSEGIKLAQADADEHFARGDR